ncbi:hypothetical protein [Pseudomonas putida]|uniref:hypothetical protein n=1 Tax=Pseudomonas putida TaxID=303 RepID=UPI003D9866DD
MRWKWNGMDVKSKAPTIEKVRETPKALMTQKEEMKAVGKLNKKSKFIAAKLLPDSKKCFDD